MKIETRIILQGKFYEKGIYKNLSKKEIARRITQ